MNKTTILLVLVLISSGTLTAQKFPNKGIPLIHNYEPAAYGKAGKAWGIASAENGIVYFATDRGLLEFDGADWKCFPGSKGFTRSLSIINDSLLYTGADKDFGRWRRDSLNQFRYRSLNPYAGSAKGLNQEFWGTHQVDSSLVFVSFDNIYVYRKEQLIQIAAPSRFTSFCQSAGILYLVDAQNGLYSFDGLNLTQRLNLAADFPTAPTIVGVHNTPQGMLVVTRNQGLFRLVDNRLTPFKAPISAALRRDQAFSFTTVDGTHYAFGTILNGVYITDLKGKIIQHINKRRGLLNNTVLSLHYSRQGKLWLGMDFGIAAIELWSDLTYFSDQAGEVGSGHAAILHEGTFYLGTNQGLYTCPWTALDNGGQPFTFTLVPGSSGQVWTLYKAGGELLCGHDRGLFRITPRSFRPVNTASGVLSLASLAEGQLLAGTYNGITLLERNKSGWQPTKQLPPIQGACNQVIPDGEGHIWVNLPNFGVIRAKLDQSISITGQRIFPAADFGNAPTQIVLTEAGVTVRTSTANYHFQTGTDSFVRTPASWFTGRVRNILPGVHRATPLNEQYGFLPAHNGFALQNTQYAGAPPLISPLAIRSVSAFTEDSTLRVAAGAAVPFSLNNIRINYAVPFQRSVKYQYRLTGQTDEWSEVTTEMSAEFLDLQPGSYAFAVRAMAGEDLYDQAYVNFTIVSPWYRSTTALLGYGLLLIGLLYLNYAWQKRAVKRQQIKLREEEQVAQRERARQRGREDMLQQYAVLEEALEEVKKQLRTKTIELARKAKESEEKSRLLLTLKEKITALESASKTNKFEWSKISRLLEEYSTGDDNSFDVQLEELHKGFIATISTAYPELTSYDLRLATYLKAGLTTREIANHLKVLPSSINVSRSRLRKKLKLDSRTDLFKFLNNL